MENKYTMSEAVYIVLTILASIGIGMICTTAVTCFEGGFNLTVMRSIIWIIASALFGLTAVLIFRNDRFSLPVGIALHMVLSLAVTFAACRFCRFEADRPLWPEILIIFLIIYSVIFCCIFLASKAEAKKINDRINDKINDRNSDRINDRSSGK